MYKKNLLYIFLLFTGVLYAQKPTSLSGITLDKSNGDTIPFVQVVFRGSTYGTTTDLDGKFYAENPRGLTIVDFKMIGYKTTTITISPNAHTGRLVIELAPEVYAINEVVITPPKHKKEKYKRKGNPAVELMQQVIAHKDKNTVRALDNYKVRTYEKIGMSFDPFDFDLNRNKFWRRFGFIRKYIDTLDIAEGLPFTPTMMDSLLKEKQSIETLLSQHRFSPVLNLSVREFLADEYHQKSPTKTKKVIVAQRKKGKKALFDDDGNMTSGMQKMLPTVDINDNNIDLLLNHFVSPLSTQLGTSFYHFYIMDTVLRDGVSCTDVAFIPVNNQTFAFTGHLYIVNDSSYALKEFNINVPPNINLNFANNVTLTQKFEQLPDGLWAPKEQFTSTTFSLTKNGKYHLMMKQTRVYNDFELDVTPPASRFYMTGDIVVDSMARKFTAHQWDSIRPRPLLTGESLVDSLGPEMLSVPLFRNVYNTFKTFIDQYVVTSRVRSESKFDFGPIWNTLSFNEQEMTRIRIGGTTTANFNPHWFMKGYIAYGFRDKIPKGFFQVAYSFNAKRYHLYESERHYLALSFTYDIEELGQNYDLMRRDNLFSSIRFDYQPKPLQYVGTLRLYYEKEFPNRFSISTWVQGQYNTPNGASSMRKYNRSLLTLKYNYINPDGSVTEHKGYHDYSYTLQLRYSPGGAIFTDRDGLETPFNLWNDAPIFKFIGTVGYIQEENRFYTRLELSGEKRFWLSAFGNIDLTISLGYIPTKVPFTKLFLSTTNQSFLLNPKEFSMLRPMEFIMDYYGQWHLTYYLRGWLFNRIPGLKKLKLREVISFHGLAGGLTNHNNPDVGATGIYQMPVVRVERDENGNKTIPIYSKTGFNGDARSNGKYKYGYMPYMELTAGIENIFKCIRIDYVRRLTHTEGLSGWKLNSIRFTFRATL